MDFSLNDDHVALRDAVQRFCDGEYPAQQRGNPETPHSSAQRAGPAWPNSACSACPSTPSSAAAARAPSS